MFVCVYARAHASMCVSWGLGVSVHACVNVHMHACTSFVAFKYCFCCDVGV